MISDLDENEKYYRHFSNKNFIFVNFKASNTYGPFKHNDLEFGVFISLNEYIFSFSSSQFN